ncbi:MAG: tetratricopeptide repeat protein [Myxococcales bacterium]|nr:tetratricopeptide repeat protein [Myxococcales bacterium]
MVRQRSGLVEIAQEFLLAYRRTREVAALHAAGELSFEVVRGWAGDDDSSALFRLKQRCHAISRAGAAEGEAGAAEGALERQALFDLTVGALFHEAMRFRENFYQREIYGPRVRKLKGVSEEEVELIREFERIVSGASERLDEALAETEALLGQARRQFMGLLRVNASDGLVARLLIENAGYVALVFDGGLDGLLSDVYGGVANGHAVAARSYLDSGHFPEAAAMLDTARAHGGDEPAWLRLAEYARAMTAYLAGSYGESVAALERWLERGPDGDEAAYAALALDAVSHLGKLVPDADRERVGREADGLMARLQTIAGG